MSGSQLLANLVLLIVALVIFCCGMSTDLYNRPRSSRKRMLISAAIFGAIPCFNLFLTAIIG